MPLEDLNQLDDWNKATIAAHLHKRFKVQRPYTSLGNIVVAVNPFEWLDLYDDDLGLAYQEPGRRDLPAHIYKSTAAAYRWVSDFSTSSSYRWAGTVRAAVRCNDALCADCCLWFLRAIPPPWNWKTRYSSRGLKVTRGKVINFDFDRLCREGYVTGGFWNSQSVKENTSNTARDVLHDMMYQ